MLKKTVSYTDYNGDPQTEDLYFNISTSESMDLLDLVPRMEAWQDRIKDYDPEASLPVNDTRELLSIIKLLIDQAYGERSANGKRFAKSEEILANFKQTAAYDAFLLTLFVDGGQGAINFLNGIITKDLADKFQNAMLPESGVQTGNEISTVQKEVPAYIRENRDPTPQELRSMSREEMQEAFARKSAN